MLISSAVRKVLGTAYYHPLLVLIPAADWDEQIDRGRSFLAPAATAQASASKKKLGLQCMILPNVPTIIPRPRAFDRNGSDR
jgi:hypothetical protein